MSARFFINDNFPKMSLFVFVRVSLKCNTFLLLRTFFIEVNASSLFEKTAD